MTSSADLLALSALITAVRLIPQETDIPEHYTTARYANSVLPFNRQLIESTSEAPRGLTDVTWPFKKALGFVVQGLDHIDRSLIFTAANVEKLFRGELGTSSVKKAEEIVQSDEKNNLVWEAELQKLAPIAQQIVMITHTAKKLTHDLSGEIVETQAEIALRRKEVQEILELRKEINKEEVLQALEKVSAYVQARLTNSDILRKLKKQKERMEQAEKKLGEACQNLTKAKETLSSHASRLQSLMKDCEELDLEQDEAYKQLKSKAEALLNKSQKHLPQQTDGQPVFA